MKGPVALATAAVLGVLVACSRTPPEPAQGTASPLATTVAPAAPSTSTTSATSTDSSGSSAKPSSRCVKATPDTPPPVATAAPKEMCPKDTATPPSLRSVTVNFPDASRSEDGGASSAKVSVDAELARTPPETERGLMFRTKMAEDHGMLFDLGDRREHVFWMHNTCLPLDMLFVDDDGTIVGILENVPTLNDAERTVGCPSSWVLEVNAGWSRRHGVRAGQRLTLPPR